MDSDQADAASLSKDRKYSCQEMNAKAKFEPLEFKDLSNYEKVDGAQTGQLTSN